MKLSYRKLEYLRKKTELDLFDKIRIDKFRIDLIETTSRINEIEHCDLGVDLTRVTEFEYKIRFEILKSKLYENWKKYAHDTDINEYCDNIMQEEIKKEDNIREQNLKMKLTKWW